MFRLLLASVALLACSQALALPSDKQQPIYIQSDSAISNEKQGLTTYTGKVEIQQGSLKISADKVVIHSKNNNVSKIIATGNLAEYEQQPSADKKLVTARAQRIEYFIDNDKLELMKSASVIQEGTTISGDKITYDIKASVVKANARPNNQNDRIQMVIQPKAENQ